MPPRDTPPQIQALMDEHLRRMSPAQKGLIVAEAVALGHQVQLAGLRLDHPSLSNEELEDLLAERRLGTELFLRVCAARNGAPPK